MSLSGHQSARMQNDEWLTPPEIVRACGQFDLDPCAPIVRPWDTAARHFTVEDDGLAQSWDGRVWCNPPFGREAIKWLRRMAEHGNGIVETGLRSSPREPKRRCSMKQCGAQRTQCCSSKDARTSTTSTAAGLPSTRAPLSAWLATA